MLYIDPANDAPGVQNGPTPGDINSYIHSVGKSYSNLLFRNHESRSFYILSLTMSSNPPYRAGSLAPLQVNEYKIVDIKTSTAVQIR